MSAGQQLADEVEQIARHPMAKVGIGGQIADVMRGLISYARMLEKKIERLEQEIAKNGR